MSIKKIVSVGLSLLLMLVLFSACSNQQQTQQKGDISEVGKVAKEEAKNSQEKEQKSDKKLIGCLVGDFSDQFQSYIKNGMEQAAASLGDGYEVAYFDAKYDQNKQLSQAENLIAEGVDAIVVIAVDKEAAKPMVEEFKGEGIPIVSISNKLANQELAQCFVGSDNIYAGELQMQAVADKLGGKGDIVILEGMYGHDPQIERQKGYENILKKYPEIKVIEKNTGNWNRAEGMKVIENWLQIHQKIDAVVAHNDEMALGALKALEDAGRLEKTIVAGIDATPEAIEYLKKGSLTITVFQDGVGQGKKAVEIAAKLAEGESVEKECMIPYELVDPKDADKYLEKYGKK